LIVDTHTHIVAKDEDRYPLSPRPLSGEWYREAPCSAEELGAEMRTCGVDRAVLVQPVGAYSFDNRYTADSAAASPGRFAAACCIDPEAADPIDTLGHWIEVKGMQGVRFFAIARSESWLAQARHFPIWERAAALGIHVITTIFTHQLPELRRMLERHPEIPVSLDHCAFPDTTAPVALLDMADLPNLHLKVSTPVLDAARKAEGTPRPFVQRLVDGFGADRIMWGSDFCQTHDRSYAELVALGQDAFAGLGETQRVACLGGTALRLWPSLATRESQRS
jgi:predicted TIM-barrel fold metal-dependent hydrolase